MKPCEDESTGRQCGAPAQEHFIVVDMHSVWLCPRHAEEWRVEDLLSEDE